MQILVISCYCPLDGLSVFYEGPHGEEGGRRQIMYSKKNALFVFAMLVRHDIGYGFFI